MKKRELERDTHAYTPDTRPTESGIFHGTKEYVR